MKEIVFAGYGGQGVLTSGLVISQIAVHKGQNATWMPSYGSAMRGGTANCTVKYGEEEIPNPSQEEPDILLAMNNPSFQKFINIVAPGGIVVVDKDMVTCDLNVRDDVRVISVPGIELAESINHKQGANIFMAGVILKATGEFTEEEGIKGMNDMFRKKGKEKYEEINTKAFRLGFNYI
ncbi:MAG: 2-oxoacid:acceptor oxidoreductase family protein [Clostridiaceae bacterium]